MGRGFLAALLLGLTTGLAPALQAQQGARADDFVAQVVNALEELTRLEARAAADRDALGVMVVDLDESLGRLLEPLPAEAVSVERMRYTSTEALREANERAASFRRAWVLREDRRMRMRETLALAEEIGSGLRLSHELLLERAVTLRPLLIEAQRRLASGELDPGQVELGEGQASVGDWVSQTAALVAQHEAMLAEVDGLLAGLDDARTSFESLPPEDPAAARESRRIALALATIAEAVAAESGLQTRLEELPPATLPEALERQAAEWRARRIALEQASAGADQARADLGALLAQRSSRGAPKLEDVPEGEGVAEVREARRRVELSKRLIAYFVADLELLAEIDAGRRTILEQVEQAAARHQEFSRQTARLFTVVKFLDASAAAGELLDWTPSPELAMEVVWDEWRSFQTAFADRAEETNEVLSLLRDEADQEADRQRIERERRNLRQAEARLASELSHSEFVASMEGRTSEELLALLAPEGEIATRLDSIEVDLGRLEGELASATEACADILDQVRALETPYSRAALRGRSDQLSRVLDELDVLQEGQEPIDRTAGLMPGPEDTPGSRLDMALHDSGNLTLLELARAETRYIELEQQFNRILFEYYVDAADVLADLRGRLARHGELAQAYEERLRARDQEWKTRYAAARELRLREADGRLEADRTPEGMDAWLDRSALDRLRDELRAAGRAQQDFDRRAAYEVERLEQIGLLSEIVQLRSERCDERARLIGRPVAYMTSALTPIEELDEVERLNLEYEARVARTKATVFFEASIERFTSRDELERFEQPLAAFYLELANAERMIEHFLAAETAYEEIVRVCREERVLLEPARELARRAVDFRLFDYHAARFMAAVARYPGSRIRLEESFRQTYGRELPYRLGFRAGEVRRVAELLFEAETRLVAQRALSDDIEELLSKVGLEQEVGWYDGKIARLRSLLEVHDGRHEDLEQRIASLEATYRAVLRKNALRGGGITLLIPFLAIVLVRFLRRFTRRFERGAVGELGEDDSDRRRRMRTISRTSTAALSVLIWIVATVYVFAQLGLDVTPIVASASVLGLALAFGAQALIKDFFYGFFILIENQFTIGDIVRLDQATGTVERISLRITVLRDLKGVVHYIPNGSIGQVSNMTQGWSRVVMEISVSYREDPDRAMAVLGDVLMELSRDEVWVQRILDEPVVAGVENLTERAVDIRVMIKTRPGRQWEVAREARRRIKLRFDEAGIVIPFPQRVVHHVYAGAEEGEERGSPEATVRS